LSRSERSDFIAWLLSAPDTPAFVVEPETGEAHVSNRLLGTLPGLDGDQATATLARIVGRNGFTGDLLRRAAVSTGPGIADETRHLWATVPIESDSGEVLLLGLYVGPLTGETPELQEAAFKAAMAEPDRRHGVNQPLTAMSFLLENLLHAFLSSSPDAAYRARKAGDLGLQIIQLRALLPVGQTLPP
jgi:hypothetical protein